MNPKNLREALDILSRNADPKWVLLAIILREMCLAQGIDLDCPIQI